jgi:formate dehydrogenase iron-sulfur subunit
MTNATNQLHLPKAVQTGEQSPSSTVHHVGESFIDALLREQQQLTAVEQFSQSYHQNGQPAEAKHYSSLLPMSPPRAGQQYAFEVDLDRCSGCKACVTACHSLNGLDEDETWRDVGLLHGGTTELPVLQHVTSACHHCLEPACLIACPVDAYEKDPVTGIVKHLDDQCFGCRYCTLACPYDVPKYNTSKGIVRKCDLCSDRLAVGEAPACVQACPHQAISITVVNIDAVIADSETNLFLPGAPDPDITLPTTIYKTNRVLPRNMLPADYYAIQREHAHWPLIVMLVLTQLSVGAFLVELLLTKLLDSALIESIRPVQTASALFFGLLALGASLFHLGRPFYAFRAVIGLRHSWLSREILAFGIFAFLATAYAGMNWLLSDRDHLLKSYINGLGWAVVSAGLAGLICSIMVYVFTRRVFWNGFYTGTKFLLTAVLLGIATTWMTIMLVSVNSGSAAAQQIVFDYGPLLCKGLIMVTGFKLLFEAALFRHLGSKQNSPLKRSALLMTGELSNATLARFSCGFLGGVFMPGFLLIGDKSANGDLFLSIVVVMLFVACLAGELLERYLFFTAVAAPKMPGDFIS